MQSISIAPPNSIIFVMDFTYGIPPESSGGKNVSATDSCIVIGCLSDQDGPTEVTLSQYNEANSFDPVVFDGEIATPSKRLSICSAYNEELLATEVPSSKTHVRVFANHESEPDRILVLFDNKSSI